MIGFVIVTHGELGRELLETSALIMPKDRTNLRHVAIGADEETAVATEKIGQSIKNVDFGEGVILLTDMFGGTPSNIGITFLEEGKVEVVSGVNLPMLLKTSMLESHNTLREAAEDIRRFGSESITVASDLLAPRSKNSSDGKSE